jgi:hypothetical protein
MGLAVVVFSFLINVTAALSVIAVPVTFFFGFLGYLGAKKEAVDKEAAYRNSEEGKRNLSSRRIFDTTLEDEEGRNLFFGWLVVGVISWGIIIAVLASGSETWRPFIFIIPQ